MKGEEIRAEHYRGFGDRAIYCFKDEDGEVLSFETNGKRREECRKIKEDWISEKKENKELRDKASKNYWGAVDEMKKLSPGEGILARTYGINVDTPIQQEKYRVDPEFEYTLIFKFDKDFTELSRKVHGETPEKCKKMAIQYLKDLRKISSARKEEIAEKIEKIIYYN